MKQEKKFLKEFYKSNLSFSKIQTFKNINFDTLILPFSLK